MERKFDLDPIFYPKTVAVIGASERPGKVGRGIMDALLSAEAKIKVYPVNIREEEILGIKAYKSILDVPDEVDLAIIAVPAKFVPSVMKECTKKKVKGVIVISAGFSETGPEGKKLEDELRRVANEAGIPVIGPNCLGIYNSEGRLSTIFNPPDRQGYPPEGGIAFLSQSGAFGAAVLDWMAENNIGMSKFISYGNKCNVYEEDLLYYLKEDMKTKVITMYLEGVSHGKEFLIAAKEVSKEKPIIVLKAGKSSRGAKAASLHTGSLAGSDSVYKGAFKQAGIIRAQNMKELFNLAKALAKQPLPKGTNVGIVTNGGGAGVMATDAVELSGLKMAELSEETKEKFEEAISDGKLPEAMSYANPVDVLGDAPPERYEIAMKYVLEDPNVHSMMVIVIAQSPAVRIDLVNKISECQKYGKPIVAVIPGGSYATKLSELLEEEGIPTYETPEEGVSGLWALSTYSEYKRR